jgi:hypothetical protein
VIALRSGCDRRALYFQMTGSHGPPTREFTLSARSQGHIGRAASHTLAALAVVAIVAGCSSSAKQAAAPATPVSTKPAATSSASTPAAKASSQATDKGHPINVCATLPPATVATIIGLPITQAQEQDVPGGSVYTCDYTSTSGTSGCTLSVTTVEGDMAYNFVLQADSSVGPAHVQQISGLGDKAFSAIDGVHVLYGKTLIAVEGLTSDPAAESLIKAMQAKL